MQTTTCSYQIANYNIKVIEVRDWSFNLGVVGGQNPERLAPQIL